jgi:hypothetical protein
VMTPGKATERFRPRGRPARTMSVAGGPSTGRPRVR